jgi:hypothetical protein
MGLCDATAGRCNKCIPNAPPQCTGNTAISCNSDGQSTSTMMCAGTSGGCDTSTCFAGACVAGSKTRGDTCSQSGGKKCDGIGRCVQCLTSGDCAKTENCSATGSCVPKPPCGNGLADFAETCEPSANKPNCDTTQCKWQERTYASCTTSGNCADEGWVCGPHGACTHSCPSQSDTECALTSSRVRGQCQRYGDGTTFTCLISCTTDSDCPSSLRCLWAYAHTFHICATPGTPAIDASQQ